MSARAWLAIPGLGALGLGTALALGRPVPVAIAAAAVAAAVGAAVRELGPTRTRDADPDATPASLVGAIAGGLFSLACVLHGHDWHAWLGAAAAAWTLAELARALPPDGKPAVALLPATVAAALDPAYVALVVVAGVRLWRAPRRPRFAIAIPIAGSIATLVAVLASRADGGVLARLWAAWSQHPVATDSPVTTQLADAIGPLGAVAALAGLAFAIRRPLALVALGAAVVAHRAGTVTPCLYAVTALAIGVAIGRLAAIVRHPTGQACIGATCGLLLLVDPAWTAIVT